MDADASGLSRNLRRIVLILEEQGGICLWCGRHVHVAHGVLAAMTPDLAALMISRVRVARLRANGEDRPDEIAPRARMNAKRKRTRAAARLRKAEAPA